MESLHTDPRVFLRLYGDSADLESELLHRAPHHSRTTASKAQLIVLETLHVRSRGRAGKEDILLAAEQTGLEVKWIRKWLSRRRCRNKSRTAPAGPPRPLDSPLSDPGSSVSILPHIDFLLSSTPGALPVPARPDLGRAYSAPVLSLTAHHYSGLELYEDMERADGLQPQMFTLPPVSALLSRTVPPADPTLASLQYPDDGSPSGSSSSEDGSPMSDVQDASPPLDLAGIDRLINRLHEVSGPSAPASALSARPPPPMIARDSLMLQSGMLSALGLELPGPVANGYFSLGLQNLGNPAPVSPPPPKEEPCAVSMHMPLAQLAAMTPNFDIARVLAEMQGGGGYPWRERRPAHEGNPPFAEPSRYLVSQTILEESQEEGEGDEDEVVTPDDEDVPMPSVYSSRKIPLGRYGDADDSGVLVY